MVTKENKTDKDFVRMYYEHQHNRIAKQEQYRLTMTNYVLTVSTLALTFGYQNATQLTIINGVGLPLIIIVANIFAIATVNRTKQFSEARVKRAREVLQKYAPELEKINELHTWPQKRFHWGRSRTQKGLHFLLICTALIPIFVYLFQAL